jgi:hypothetical protein
MLAISLNVKVFLNSEPHHELADAMLLASGALGISTVVYQFSNLAYINPMMMSTADKFLIFSEMYKKVFVTKNVRPREFIITGYLYDHIPLLVRRNSISHRSKIKDAGAEFIVCYFDESFQNDRWGSTTPKDHSDMVQKLAEMVIADSAIGVIIKSQFIRNTPSRLYKDSALVSAAMNTQRFIELASGTHRNDIYPAEAALAADLCIGHKLGLTAVLEAALCGCRAVFINNNKLKSNWDYLYELANLEFDSIQSLETAITQYRNGDANQQSLGDWTDIIDFFDSYRDSCSVVRLRSIVEELLVANQ